MASVIDRSTPGDRATPPSALPVVLAGFAAFLDLYVTQPLLPLLMQEFHTGHLAVSLTVTAPTIAVAMAAPLVGRLADRVGRKRVIIGSAWLLAVTTALGATARSLPQLIGWRFAQGLATPGIFAVAIAYVHEEWPASYVGRATAAYVSGTVIGGFCGRALVGVMAANGAWHSAFAMLAVLNVAVAAALTLWLPAERGRGRTRLSAGDASSWRHVLTNSQLMATNVVGFCLLFTLVAAFTYVTFHLSAAPYFLSTAALGWLFVVYLVGAIVTPFAGRLVDVRGHRVALGFGAAVGGAGAVLTLAPWLPSIVAGLALIGTGVFVAQATASSYIGTVTEEDRGLAVGLYSTCYYLGGSVGGALPGLFWDTGGWPACVALVMIVQGATAAVALRYWRAPGAA